VSNEFEKCVLLYATNAMTAPGSITIRAIAAHFWKVRQPEIDVLKAEVERLRRDAGRLDALDLPGIELTVDHDPEPTDDAPIVVSRISGSRNDREWEELGRGITVREAIDAAMKEPK
jgi:hypothetical protein